MEHLFDQEELIRQNGLPVVPWLGFDHDETNDYPIVPIEQYPLLRGWTPDEINHLKEGITLHRTPRDALAMIQSWLFLGLLEAFFNARFSSSNFLFLDQHGELVVRTQYLRDYIDSWHRRVHDMRPQNSRASLLVQQGWISQSLDEAQFWNHKLNLLDRNIKEATSSLNLWSLLDDLTLQRDYKGFGTQRSLFSDRPLFDSVMRLITTVAETLSAASERFPTSEERFALQYNWHITKGNEASLRENLKRRGWCPSLFGALCEPIRMPTSLIGYICEARLAEGEQELHKNCSPNKCVGYSVDPFNYKRQHVNHGCCCEALVPSLDIIKNTLYAGAIPLINSKALLNGDPETVLPLSEHMDFVAVSHVWSDGLGSDSESGLFRCQIEYLRDIANKLQSTAFIWIDSLCVPREKDARKRAITMMADTYRAASATIVLDSRIKRCSVRASTEAKMITLATSVWQQRLWTLQEGALAENLVFQIDGFFLRRNEFLNIAAREAHRPVVRSAYALLDNITGWVINSNVTIGAVQRNIAQRTSSKSDDEALAIASLLKLDISPLLETNGADRMLKFWEMVPRVPRDIIWLDCPKFEEMPFRWAPRSLMSGTEVGSLDLRDESAITGPLGIKGTWHIYSFKKVSTISLSSNTPLLLPLTSSSYVLQVDMLDGSSNIPIFSFDAILVDKQLIPSQLPSMGLALSHLSGNQIYKYERLVRVNITTEYPYLLSSMLRWIKGGVTSQTLDIIIS